MDSIIRGVDKFHQQVYPNMKDLFHRLANGQKPGVLFITCADSRIDPSLLTQSVPGELFIQRNAGNIVPAYPAVDGVGVGSAIEFAVANLPIEHVIVCGHSDCGAMKALITDQPPSDLPLVTQWIQHARDAADKASSTGQPSLERIIEANVLLQLEHLKTHPVVQDAMKQRQLKLHGWVFDIGPGEVRAYDPQQKRFVRISSDTPVQTV